MTKISRTALQPIGVVGLGLMGQGIAACLLSRGLRVVAHDRNPAKEKAAIAHIRTALRELAKRGIIPASRAKSWLRNFRFASAISDLKPCAFVVESIPEDLEAKRSVYEALEAALSAKTVISSNTSSLPITVLQAGRKHPERIIGMHWGEPAQIMRYLEIIPGRATNSRTLRLTQELGAICGKEPTVLREDIRGFLSNRMMYAMIREAFHLVESGVADVETVDRSFRNDMGWWALLAGPFRWMDLTGIPAYGAVMEGLLPQLCNAKKVPKLMRDVVAAGATGVGNARGFYRYKTKAEARRWEKNWVEFTYDMRKVADKYAARGVLMAHGRGESRADWAGYAAAAVLAAGIGAVYSNTFSVPWLLDDYPSIVHNPSIQGFAQALAPPADSGTGGRPFLNLTFFLNHAAGGLAPGGYHVVNLLIHVAAAWLVFGIVRRTLKMPALAERFESSATLLALAVAALWAWHPVQTESVTYVSQRAESLMGMFYLLSLYAFIRRSLGLSFVCCLCGMATKEVMVTAPVAILLYDRAFVSGSFAKGWAYHRRYYLGLAATWIVLALFFPGLGSRGVGMGRGIPALGYAAVECRAIVTYLRLAFWPSPLVFDYGGYHPEPFANVWGVVLATLVLLGIALVALRKWPRASYPFTWFFLVLLPTSSFVPIAGAPISENRLYLALAGVVCLALVGGFCLAGRGGRWTLAVWAAVALVGSGLAWERNRDYRSAAVLWKDTVLKRPGNARAHNNLGLALEEEPGGASAAIEQFETAVRLEPNLAEAHNDLGNALVQSSGPLDQAVAELHEAIRLKPNYPEAYDNLGFAWSKIPGYLSDSVDAFRTAIRLKPDFAEAHDNLGSVLYRSGRHLPEAISEYQKAILLEPDNAAAHDNLGSAWFSSGKLPDAIREFEEAVRLGPDRPVSWDHLGVARARSGDLAGAVRAFRQEVSLDPGSDVARRHLSLASAQAATGAKSP